MAARLWRAALLAMTANAVLCAPPRFSPSSSTGSSSGGAAGGGAAEAAGGAWHNVSLRIVRDVYGEEGVTIRHMGTLRNIVALTQDEIHRASLTPPGTLMDFSAVRGASNGEEQVPAYAFAVKAAGVGYEGLVFDDQRVFDLEGEWSDSLTRPEALTHARSADRPMRDGVDKERVVMRWGDDWPRPAGWRGWFGQDGGAPAASGATWEHRPAIVSLLQRSSHAYYHFFGEALPKLYLLAQDLEHSNAVLLTDTSFGNTWTVEFLHLLGVPRDRLLNRVPGKVYLADTIYSSRPTPLHRPYPALLCRVRAALLGAALPRPHGGAYSDGEVREMGSDARRIVVVQRTGANNQHSLQHAACRATKGGCRVREVVNMEELILGLRSAFPAREISTFDSLGLTLLQQVRLFAGAEAVVGAHGAGLSNAAMCAPGGVVLELLPQMLQRASVVSIFWHVASATGLRHATYIVPHNLMTPDNATSLHNFRVPVPEVVDYLGALLDVRSAPAPST